MTKVTYKLQPYHRVFIVDDPTISAWTPQLSTRDLAKAEKLAGVLRAAGHKVTIDSRDLCKPLPRKKDMNVKDGEAMNIEFKECSECSSKVGAPHLCESCLHNRTVVNALSKELEETRTRLGEMRQSVLDALPTSLAHLPILEGLKTFVKQYKESRVSNAVLAQSLMQAEHERDEAYK
jgi:hypothetical protein